MTKTNISINVTAKAIEVKNGKTATTVPYITTAKGVKWYVSKGAKGDYISVGFKVYSNGETRANIYLHDYANKFASLKTADGKALETIAKATPMTTGKKYTVTNLSPEGLKNFAIMFASFEATRLADNKAKASKPEASKPEAKPTKASKPTTKPTAKPTAKPTKAKASKPTAKPENKPTKASKPEAKPEASKPEAKPEASTKTA